MSNSMFGLTSNVRFRPKGDVLGLLETRPFTVAFPGCHGVAAVAFLLTPVGLIHVNADSPGL